MRAANLRNFALMALAAVGLLAAPAAPQEHGVELPRQAWSFNGPFGKYDRNAVQRGFLVYQTVCSTCHALEHLSYRNLGEPGGPFEAFWVMNEETGQEEITTHPGHGRRVDPNENPYVRAIAGAVMIRDIDRETGEATERAGRPSDHFRRPYANRAAAAAANGGAVPPDLSVINLARKGGADYTHAILTGYTGEEREGRYVNTYFPGELIGMPPPLSQAGLVTYEDGTEATVDQMASDVAHFLQWAADPHMKARNEMGLIVMIFLIILAALTYLAYKNVWRDVKH